MRIIVGIAALIFLVVGIDLWAMLDGKGQFQVGLWPFDGTATWPLGMAVGLGILIGATASILLMTILARQPVDPATQIVPGPTVESRSNPIAIAVGITAGILLIVAVRLEKIQPVTAAIVFVLGFLAVLATLHALASLARGDGVSFDSYWGGLGGAQGGWRVSPVTTSLVLALVLVAATVAVATGTGPTSAIGNQQTTANANTADDGAEVAGTDPPDNGAAATTANAAADDHP